MTTQNKPILFRYKPMTVIETNAKLVSKAPVSEPQFVPSISVKIKPSNSYLSDEFLKILTGSTSSHINQEYNIFDEIKLIRKNPQDYYYITEEDDELDIHLTRHTILDDLDSDEEDGLFM